MRISFIILISVFSLGLYAQQLPSDRVLKTDELHVHLKKDIKNQIEEGGSITEAQLANYLREKFSERFFYDHKTIDQRFQHYNKLYQNEEDHKNRALDHMGKYADSTQWVLPFNYLNGDAVNAYALRHLARQHKMVDIIMQYFHEGKDPKYINYFKNQMRSLNAALDAGQYEKIEDGNGVYEVFRSGYRILNWLWIHNMILNEPAYSDKDQLLTIATLLQHGQHLYEHNDQFDPGNHQTRGMSALAMISILLRDFQGTELWYDRAMMRLSEHLDKEINKDGFQFERSVHYHMSDINNYYYVYQLAKLSDFKVDKAWEEKLRSLFTTLVKVAYPDKSAPVLQDDTDSPWAEKNDISGTMTLGYLLFEDPEFGYFATDKVENDMYWFLSKAQVELLGNIQRKKPSIGSFAFTDTHYYIMREGWNPKDKMMIVSAGLDDEKPDHQHGDMLGVQAMANGQVVLPNYQVRYSLTDFDLFKNSLVKNVALVDNELQGKQWTSNQGGSGFGKFGKLPNPKTLAWNSNDKLDVFAGSHDGFEDIGVGYTRQVIYVKDDFWIVKDNFESQEPHAYKQVWQGHYTKEHAPNLLRATFENGTGLDIFQLIESDEVTGSGSRGKEWSMVTKKGKSNFSFVTVLLPYNSYDKRIDETTSKPTLHGWKVNDSEWKADGINITSMTQNGKSIFFSIKKLSNANVILEFSEALDVFVELNSNQIQLQTLSASEVQLSVKGIKDVKIDGNGVDRTVKFVPGSILTGTIQD